MMIRVLFACLSIALLLAARPAAAQGFPERPIRMVIPYPAGGAIDLVARRIVNEWVGRLGQQIVVDNRGGAGGTIGSELVARATPNGYTILYANNGPLAIAPHLYGELRYGVLRDFAPVTLATSAPYVLFVSTRLPVNSAKELVEYARSRPGELNYASSGVGAGGHLTSELFARVAGLKLVHVPFRGLGVAIPEIAAGRVHLLVYPYSGAEPHVKAGRLKPIMSAGTRRSPRYPDVPTAAEAGMPSFNSSAWHAVVAPAGTPRAVVDRLQQTFKAAVAHPPLQSAMAATDVELVAGTPEELSVFLRTENEKWGQVIRSAGIKSE